MYTIIIYLFIFLHISNKKCSAQTYGVSSGPININRHLHTWTHFIEFQTRHAVVCAIWLDMYLLLLLLMLWLIRIRFLFSCDKIMAYGDNFFIC